VLALVAEGLEFGVGRWIGNGERSKCTIRFPEGQGCLALKFLPPSLSADPVALERFKGEVRTARQVTHTNVCRIHDLGQAEGQPWLAWALHCLLALPWLGCSNPDLPQSIFLQSDC
jgi:serine/threonine protein kinase